MLATPVLYRDRIYVASGQEVEHGEVVGRLVCMDPTKTGDISAELAIGRDGRPIPHRRLQAVDPDKGERAIANPNSGVIWEFSSEGVGFEDQMHRTIASVAIRKGLLIATDFSGLVHCFDADTGERHWIYDCFAAIWSTPLIVADRVYVADEDGDMAVFALSADADVVRKGKPDIRDPLRELYLGNGVAGSPIFANGTLYVATRNALYAIANERQQPAGPVGKAERSVGGHWPRWRGPQGNNRSTESGLLPSWPEKGPPLLWRADGLGEGIASFSIADGRIVTISQREETEYVRALDEATGRHLWTARLGTAIPQSRLMRWLTQRAPTIEADRVYAVSLLGELVCLRARDGRELWRRSYAKDFAGERPVFGYADCPLIEGDWVIAVPGGPENSVVALARESGVVVWKCAVPEGGRASHTSGVVANVGGVRQLVTFLEKSLVGIDVDDGTLLWRDDSSVDRWWHPNTPFVVKNQLVLINAGPGFRSIMVNRKQDRFQVEHVHSHPTSHFDRSHESAFLIGDHVYELTRVGACLNWKKGEFEWRKRLSRRPSSATWAEDRFYVHASDGVMKLYEATSSGCSEKGSFALPDHEDMVGATAPVVAGGCLYVREDDRLFCFDIRRESAAKPADEPRRIALPDLQAAAVGLSDSTDAASDSRRIVNSVYSPTPQDVVTKMLELVDVGKDDVLFDLGSGDGRIVIAAAKEYGCRAVGYELDGDLAKLSRQKAEKAGVKDRVTFHRADLFTADLTGASVVALYLLPIQNERLLPQLKRLPARSRIVSHQYAIPGVAPEKVIIVESNESGESHRLFLYATPLQMK